MRNGQRLHNTTHNKLDVKRVLVYVLFWCINQEPGEQEKHEKKAIAPKRNKLTMKDKRGGKSEEEITKKRIIQNGFFELLNRLDN